MATSDDRAAWYVLGAAALVYLATRKTNDASPVTARNDATDPIVTFPPVDPTVDLTGLFCAPWDPYGGWGDDRKIEEATRLYVERWAFSPPPEFNEAVAKRDPCERRHFDALVNAYPPFPGQSFRVSELAAKKARQADARKAKAAADARAKADCKTAVVGGTSAVVGVTAGVLAGVGTLGAGVVPAAGAGLSAGSALGGFFSGIWC